MFTAQKNLLLEGLTDLWYLQGINSLVKNQLNEDIALLPVGGVTKITIYANILCNNNLKTVALIDSDNEANQIAQDAIIKYKLGNKKINENDKTSTQPIINIFKKTQKDFSKDKLAKAFLNWAKEKSLSDLTTNEQTHCQNLINTTNRRLK